MKGTLVHGLIYFLGHEWNERLFEHESREMNEWDKWDEWGKWDKWGKWDEWDK